MRSPEDPAIWEDSEYKAPKNDLMRSQIEQNKSKIERNKALTKEANLKSQFWERAVVYCIVLTFTQRIEAFFEASESEGEKRVRRRGIDYTDVHKDAGVYTKTDVSNLATVFHPRIMSNIRCIKSPFKRL